MILLYVSFLIVWASVICWASFCLFIFVCMFPGGRFVGTAPSPSGPDRPSCYGNALINQAINTVLAAKATNQSLDAISYLRGDIRGTGPWGMVSPAYRGREWPAPRYWAYWIIGYYLAPEKWPLLYYWSQHKVVLLNMNGHYVCSCVY